MTDAQPPSASEVLRRLIEKWRDESSKLDKERDREDPWASDYEAAAKARALRSCADQVEAALSTLPVSSGSGQEWQPIEAADEIKDGRLVLLYGRFVNHSTDQPGRYIGVWFQGYSDRGWWTVAALPFEPTHWADLLPAPPASSALSPTERAEKEEERIKNQASKECEAVPCNSPYPDTQRCVREKGHEGVHMNAAALAKAGGQSLSGDADL